MFFGGFLLRLFVVFGWFLCGFLLFFLVVC